MVHFSPFFAISVAAPTTIWFEWLSHRLNPSFNSFRKYKNIGGLYIKGSWERSIYSEFFFLSTPLSYLYYYWVNINYTPLRENKGSLYLFDTSPWFLWHLKWCKWYPFASLVELYNWFFICLFLQTLLWQSSNSVQVQIDLISIQVNIDWGAS